MKFVASIVKVLGMKIRVYRGYVLLQRQKKHQTTPPKKKNKNKKNPTKKHPLKTQPKVVLYLDQLDGCVDVCVKWYVRVWNEMIGVLGHDSAL